MAVRVCTIGLIGKIEIEVLKQLRLLGIMLKCFVCGLNYGTYELDICYR